MKHEQHIQPTKHKSPNHHADNGQQGRILLGLLIFLGFAALAAVGLYFVVITSQKLGPPKDTEVGIVAVVATVTLLAILGQILVTVFQWQAMRDVVEQNERSLAEMESSRVLAHSPFVGCEGIDPRKLRVGKLQIHTFSIKNTGTTPAFNVEVDLETRTVPETRNFPTQPPSQQSDPHGTIISQGTSPVTFFIEELTEGHIYTLENDFDYFYLWGTIRYSDIFGKEHWTNFGFHYFAGNGTFLRTDTWNDCDYQYKDGKKPNFAPTEDADGPTEGKH